MLRNIPKGYYVDSEKGNLSENSIHFLLYYLTYINIPETIIFKSQRCATRLATLLWMYNSSILWRAK